MGPLLEDATYTLSCSGEGGAVTSSVTIGVEPPPLRAIVVDSAKQARYIRDMIHCPTLLTSTENAVETAVSGVFVPRW